jgi:hypothetical protein
MAHPAVMQALISAIEHTQHSNSATAAYRFEVPLSENDSGNQNVPGLGDVGQVDEAL